MGRTYPFVDESGNHDLDTSKSGSSDFFVICSVLINEEDLPQAYELAEVLRSQHFQTGEIKSSKLKAKDLDRRRKILVDLATLPLKLYFTVVDKSRVYKDGGLQFKQSFIPPPVRESAYADYRVHQQALKQADQFLAKNR